MDQEYVQDDEHVRTMTDATSTDHGLGTLTCTDDRLVFTTGDGAILDIDVDRIDALEYTTGDGWTDNALTGLAATLFGAVLCLVPVILSAGPSWLHLGAAGWGFTLLVAGLGLILVYYDTTTGLHVYAGDQRWTFEGGGQLDAIPHAVRAIEG
jgi:hypothetical protein